jgi:uncharacterized phiE125 gp8 family phage protein
MDGWPVVVTEPSEEPITVAEAKSHMRVDVTTEDTLIAAYISAARQVVEQRTWRTLVTTTLDYYLQGWPSGDTIVLPRPPLASVTSVTYTDSDGTAATLDSDDYHVDTVSTPGQVVLAYSASWPTGTLRTSNPIVVRYVAGYGGASSVPEWAKLAIRWLASHYYENREAVTLAPGVVAVNVPMGVDSVLWANAVR